MVIALMVPGSPPSQLEMLARGPYLYLTLLSQVKPGCRWWLVAQATKP